MEKGSAMLFEILDKIIYIPYIVWLAFFFLIQLMMTKSLSIIA